MTQLIKSLAEILAAAMKDEQTFAEVNRLYNESFRAPNTFSVADDIYSREDLIEYLMEPILKLVGEPFDFSLLVDDEDDYIPEPEYEVIKEGWSREKAEQLVDHLQFVEVCNYKGEGEGFELVARVEHFRVFHSKYDYR